MSSPSTTRDLQHVLRYLHTILGPERGYMGLTLVYGVGISLLSLATPISVQMLINTVANTGLAAPLVILSVSLFVLLLLAGLLNALRIHLMDIYSRRFYARMLSEVALRSVFALNPFFDDQQKGPLFNRYFDIIVVLKSLPNLLVGGFTIVIQALVGFVLVSFYHPLFLAFNIVTIILIWLVWMVWGKRAIGSAVDLSHQKHAVAAWLEGLGASNGFFKSEKHIAAALDRTNELTESYIDLHKQHFRHHFSQTICFLLIYAAASATLLGLGGWLVIRGELSLGQLVAAELVLSVVYYSIAQLGVYLTYYYDLCAAVDELAMFYEVPQETAVGEHQPASDDARLAFVNAKGEARNNVTTLNLEIASGTRVMAHSSEHSVQRVVCNLLKHHTTPDSGYVVLGGIDIMGLEAHTLRQVVMVLNRPNAIEMTIREFLELSAVDSHPERLLEVIEVVGLGATVAGLRRGLDTPIAMTGWPLDIIETMKLKLASAIIAQPRVLVLNELFDMMTEGQLRRSLDILQAQCECTVIYFSNRNARLNFDSFLYMRTDRQTIYPSFEEMLAAEGATALGMVEPDDRSGQGPDQNPGRGVH